MESLVVTLDTAKKLKVVGFPQDKVVFWWGERPTYEHQPDEWQVWTSQWEDRECPAAPTAQEIADQLPAFRVSKDASYSAIFEPQGRNIAVLAPTMAEALAALYLKLQEKL